MKKAISIAVVFSIALTMGAAQNYWPRHTVQDLKNSSHFLSDYASDDGITLFVFWKTCCPNNITMINELNEVWEEYDNVERPIRIVLVSMDDQRTAPRVRPIVYSNGWEWEVIMDNNGDLARIYNVTMPPQWIAVDSEGQIVYRSKITNGALDSALYFGELISRINEIH